MNFKNWQDYENRNEEFETKIYHKAALKKMRLKPEKDAVPEIHKVFTAGGWRKFEFFTLDQTQIIKTRTKQEIRELDLTLENICESLYIINRSAKKSRDTKNSHYFQRNFGIVAKAKSRQNNLYELKNNVMEKLINDNELKLQGYHKQHENYLLYYVYNNFGFHMISNQKDIENIKFLGDIDENISAEKTSKCDIKFNEAIDLLERFLI